MTIEELEALRLRRIEKYTKEIENIFNKAATEAASIGQLFSSTDLFSKPFSFSDYPITKDRVDKLMKSMSQSIEATVVNGVTAEWKDSNYRNDLIAQSILGLKPDDEPNTGKFKKYFNNNNEALQAFLKRKDYGLNLSDRVWKYTEKFKSEIELGLDTGIRAGLPASEMARDLKQYLQYPDKLFRRVRDQHGNLQLSKAAAKFHPGQGVYRSSYKNAMRLTRTETNMAYHAANHERYQQWDFIVGIEVRLTNNPGHVTDICDELKGKYPKTFKFTGWHPHCMCHTVTILKTQAEIDADVEKIANGEQTDGASRNAVKEMPGNFKSWAEANQGRIASAKNMPYFIKDNFTGTDTSKWFIKPVEPAKVVSQKVEAKLDKTQQAESKINNLPNGKIFDDAKRIDGIFSKSNHSWSEVIEAYENNKHNSVGRNINISNIKITQPNIQAKKVNKMLGSIDELPKINVVRFENGELAIFDGHHRLMANWATGRTDIKVNMVKLRTQEQRAAIQNAWDARKAAKQPAMPFEFTDEVKARLEKKYPKVQIHDEVNALFYKKAMGEANIEELIDDINEIITKKGFKTSLVRIRREVDSVDLAIVGETKNKEAFQIMRTFSKKGNKRIVEHDLLTIPDSMQGNGMSKDVFKSLYKQYKKGGIEEIRVHANINVGGYTWGKYGFQLEKWDAENLIKDRSLQLTSVESKDAMNTFKKWGNENPGKDMFPMRLLADKSYGKKMLLGSNWYGQIDLTDLAQKKTFEDYLYKTKKAAAKAVKTADQKAAIQQAWDERRVINRRKQIAEIAEKRHAARTGGKIEEIQKAWDKRKAEIRRKQILEKAEKRHAARTGVQKQAIQIKWENRIISRMDGRLPITQLAATEENINNYIKAFSHKFDIQLTKEEAVKSIANANAQRLRITPEFISKAKAAGVDDRYIESMVKVSKLPTSTTLTIRGKIDVIEKEIIKYEKKITAAATPTPAPAPVTPSNSVITKPIKTADDLRDEIVRLSKDDNWFTAGFNKLEESDFSVNGNTDREKGIIRLNPDRMKRAISGVEKIRLGKDIEKGEADALATFWHEITHNRNIHKTSHAFSDEGTRYMELANEFIARKTIPEFYSKLGLKETPWKQFMTERRSTGYNDMVCNYEKTIKALNINMDDAVAAVKNHLYNEKYWDQLTGLEDALLNNLPKGSRLGYLEISTMVEKCSSLSETRYRTWLKGFLK